MFGSLEGEGVDGKRIARRRVEENNYPQWRSQDFNLGGDKIKIEKIESKIILKNSNSILTTNK